MSSGISPKKEYSGKALDQSIDNLKPLEDYFEKKPNLNNEQKHAASSPEKNILVLAGAGCGKTKTIIARAEYLIENHSPANKVHILTFTRKASAEIVQRVKSSLGEKAEGLKATTFHTWCMSLIRKSPDLFGCRDFSVIDRDDQLSIFKFIRAASKLAKEPKLPRAGDLLDAYSFTRNIGGTLKSTFEENYPSSLGFFEQVKEIVIAYEKRKENSKYLDYDDILEVVANQIINHSDIRDWVASQQSDLLIDEFQDTNPLQWKLINPLIDKINLFCVGDDAQSIYGFRGADFENIHKFKDNVENSTILKLNKNYRSTQEILDLSNWLLDQSHLSYKKKLIADRGSGIKPQVHTFLNEWDQAGWIADDLKRVYAEGNKWRENMILTRTGYSARSIERALIEAKIPYFFIGGRKLLESAHVRDVLSCLKVVANPKDDLGWIRFLKLWPGIGDVKASNLLKELETCKDIKECTEKIKRDRTIPKQIPYLLEDVSKCETPRTAFRESVIGLREVLEQNYKGNNWEKRVKDFSVVEQLTEKSNSILEFIEAYILEPIYESELAPLEPVKDAVTVITIHSAKGAESKRCYVINVSPGMYPLTRTLNDDSEVEEERRVLYVALTRAKDELIITRSINESAASAQKGKDDKNDLYFLANLEDDLIENEDHRYLDSENQFSESKLTKSRNKPSTSVDLE